MKQAIGWLFCGLLSTGYAASAEPGFAPIEVQARALGEFLPGSGQTRFGNLEFRGGLVLKSTDRRFSSLSGVDFASDPTTLYAVTDTGFWFTGRLVQKNGRLVDLVDARLAPILNAGGEPLASKSEYDAEGLRIFSEGGSDVALVSFEQTASLRRFVGPDFADARATPIKLAKFVRGVRRNAGFEAVAVAPIDSPLQGAIVLCAERSPNAEGNHKAFILSGPRAGAFYIRRSGDFDITDAAFLPDGDLLILERKFSVTRGFATRIRRLAGAGIRPGVTVDGPVVLDADMSYEIDNMEGLAIGTNADGETVLTLISDDNGIVLQRSLILQFALRPQVPPMPPIRPQAAAAATDR